MSDRMRTKELIEELRRIWDDCGFIMEAADRLEQLEKENKRLREALELELSLREDEGEEY